jgi:hypothetical protein
MTEKKHDPRRDYRADGYQANGYQAISKGYQAKPQGGHQATTSQAGGQPKPPSGGSSESD